jgi:Carbohydrate family 9 binding domain-like/Domain of unknown function (DUF5916)
MKNITSLCLLLLFCALNSAAQTSTPTVSTTGVSSENLLASPQPSPSPSGEQTPATTKLNVEKPASPYARKDAAVKIPRFETAPVIDGQLNDAIWQTAALFGDFVQTNPGDNVAPTHPTEFMMGYDAKNLYLAFRIKQDRDTVRATVARRDNIFNDDYVLVHLDTFNDQRQAYLLFFSPLGIQADGTFTEGRGEDYSLDILMESKGVLTEDGYTIEVAIPFKSLRYEAGKDKQWGLHINRRVKYKNNEYNSWMPTNRSISGWLNQAGHITGLEGIETTRQLEINPSITLSETGRRTRFTFDGDPAGRFVNEGLKGEFGTTAKFSLTPTITLDFAYNPDFAQVEADAPVTTANQRFPIFFAEKRPFFLERIDIFRSGLDVVNTRAIVDPDVAVKLTGRRGPNTFGLLYASDNAPGNYSKDERQGLFECQLERITDPTVVCGIERFVDKNAHIGILRIKRDVGRQHNLGFFATSYNFIERHNNTGGFDGRFRLDEKTVTEFQVLGTTSRRNFYDPDLDRTLFRTGNGLGYRAFLERADRNLYMNFLAMGRSPDYRADVGFTQRFDTNYLGSYIRYETDRDRKKSIIYKRVQNSSNVSYDWRGRSQYSITDTNGMLALQRQTFVQLGFQLGYERVFEHEYGANRTATRRGALFGPDPERSARFKAVQGFIESTPNKQLYLFFFLDHTWGLMDFDIGNGPDFPRVSRGALLDPDGGYDPGPGNQLYIDASIRYQPTTAFQTQLNYNKRRLVRHDTGLVSFDDNIFSSRSTYQFSRNTFARLRLDYSSLNKHLRPQLVVGWTPNPGTALYVGYNDDVSYNGYNPFSGQFEPGLQGNGRSFFIKASYLFRKSF